MKEEEIQLYEENLKNYSLFIKNRSGLKTDILKCIKIFEYFEDYEKCKDLLEIINDPLNINKNRDKDQIGKSFK